jgi:DNA-binding NtrC family response regulator
MIWRVCELGKVRILVVDDDVTIRATFRAWLTEQGFEVDVAATGKEAVDKSQNEVYNLALVDIRLPDMEGIRLLKDMKETTPRMRKIIVTGYPDLQNAVASVRNHADYYFIKPVSLAELTEVIKEQLREQEAEREYGQRRVADFVQTRLRENPD